MIERALHLLANGCRRIFSASAPTEAASTRAPDSGAERRRALRLPMHITASLELDSGREFEAIVVDLSEGGMAVQAATPVQTGRVVSFRFGLPGTKAAFEASGEIVWADQEGRAGIRFRDVPKISKRQLLSAWLRHLAMFPANPAGIAVESLRTFDAGLTSQQEWVSTDSIEDDILIHDHEFRILKINRALLNRIGCKHHDEVIGKTCESVLPGSGEAWKQCPYCSREICVFGEAPDPCFGGFSMVSTSTYSEGSSRALGTIHIIKDVTNQRAAEQKYRLLFDQAQEGVFVSTPDGRFLDCNGALVRMLGYSSQEELLAAGTDNLYPDAAQHQAFCREMDKRNCVRNHEITLRKKNGDYVTVLETAFASRDASGSMVSCQGFLLDVTEKKRAEDEVRRRNRELYTLNAISVIAAQSFDLAEILQTTLRHVVEFFAADAGAAYLIDEGSKVLRRRAECGDWKDLAAQTTAMELSDEFLEQLRSSGTEVLVQNTIAHLPETMAQFLLPGGMHSGIWAVLWVKDKVVGIVGASSRKPRDFSATDENLLISVGRQLATTIEKVRLYAETARAYEDLRHTQEQLLQSEKMAAVGQLTAGVAHEINNPLTAILGYTELLQDQELNEGSRDFVQKLQKQAQRTHKIVQNLLSFSRQRKPQRLQTGLCRVLENTLSLRDYHFKVSNIVLERNFEFPLPLAVADTHQIEQVFLNIINNAVDAMLEKGKGGTLRIRHFEQEGRIITEFHDSGPGIKDPKRVFDPFYTTKEVGKGTGLGLSICDGIMRQHGGEIIARNHPDGGAVFRVCFPAVVSQVVKTEKRSCLKTHESILRGRILVLDPDPTVLDFEREMLQGIGAEVTAVGRGQDAIARLQKERFDVLVLDGKAPAGLSGIDVYEWAAENRPGLERKIIMTFSDLMDGKARRFVNEKAVERLFKPFEVADLVAMIQRLLDNTLPVTKRPSQVAAPHSLVPSAL